MTTRYALHATLLLALALFVAGCAGDKSSAKAGAETPPARLAAEDVATVTRTDLTAGIPVSGTLTPGKEVHITAPIEDVIEEVVVREGQAVSKGQVLARFRMSTVTPAAASAAAQLKVAAADYERQKNLFKEGAVSARDVDAAEAAWKAADATHADMARRLSDATVRAPFTGTVARRSVQSGDRVGMGDPLFDVVNTSELEFEATVPTEFVRSIKVGAPVALTVTGYPAGSIVGKVARINATADEATRQVKIYVVVPNPGNRMVGGLFASGSIVTDRKRDVLAMPGIAVRTSGDSAFVMAVADGKLQRRPVQIGLRDPANDMVEVTAGLREGETVVTGPIEGLADQQPVLVAGKEQ